MTAVVGKRLDRNLEAMHRNSMAAIDIRSGRGGRGSWPGDAPCTVIQGDLTIIGDLQTDGHIQVDGRVIGNVNGSSVTVGESGQVEGSILADTVTILGVAVGPVQANKVRVGKSAQVVGNIFHNELTIEPGAYHEGRRPWRPNIERKPIFER